MSQITRASVAAPPSSLVLDDAVISDWTVQMRAVPPAEGLALQAKLIDAGCLFPALRRTG